MRKNDRIKMQKKPKAFLTTCLLPAAGQTDKSSRIITPIFINHILFPKIPLENRGTLGKNI